MDVGTSAVALGATVGRACMTCVEDAVVVRVAPCTLHVCTGGHVKEVWLFESDVVDVVADNVSTATHVWVLTERGAVYRLPPPSRTKKQKHMRDGRKRKRAAGDVAEDEAAAEDMSLLDADMSLLGEVADAQPRKKGKRAKKRAKKGKRSGKSKRAALPDGGVPVYMASHFAVGVIDGGAAALCAGGGCVLAACAAGVAVVDRAAAERVRAPRGGAPAGMERVACVVQDEVTAPLVRALFPTLLSTAPSRVVLAADARGCVWAWPSPDCTATSRRFVINMGQRVCALLVTRGSTAHRVCVTVVGQRGKVVVLACTAEAADPQLVVAEHLLDTPGGVRAAAACGADGAMLWADEAGGVFHSRVLRSTDDEQRLRERLLVAATQGEAAAATDADATVAARFHAVDEQLHTQRAAGVARVCALCVAGARVWMLTRAGAMLSADHTALSLAPLHTLGPRELLQDLSALTTQRRVMDAVTAQQNARVAAATRALQLARWVQTTPTPAAVLSLRVPRTRTLHGTHTLRVALNRGVPLRTGWSLAVHMAHTGGAARARTFSLACDEHVVGGGDRTWDLPCAPVTSLQPLGVSVFAVIPLERALTPDELDDMRRRLRHQHDVRVAVSRGAFAVTVELAAATFSVLDMVTDSPRVRTLAPPALAAAVDTGAAKNTIHVLSLHVPQCTTLQEALARVFPRTDAHMLGRAVAAGKLRVASHAPVALTFRLAFAPTTALLDVRVSGPHPFATASARAALLDGVARKAAGDGLACALDEASHRMFAMEMRRRMLDVKDELNVLHLREDDTPEHAAALHAQTVRVLRRVVALYKDMRANVAHTLRIDTVQVVD